MSSRSKPIEVRVFSIQSRLPRNGSGRLLPHPHIVRWSVNGKQHSKAFKIKTEAETYRASLIVAQRNGEKFDITTGRPQSWLRTEITVAVWAKTWVDQNWDSWSPRSRRSVVEVLTRFLVLAVSDTASEPPVDIAAQTRSWLKNGRTSATPTPSSTPAWITRWSLSLTSLDRPRCDLLKLKLLVRADGKRFKASTSQRYRTTIGAMLEDAVMSQHLESNDWSIKRNATQKKRNKEKISLEAPVDLPTPRQVRAALDKVVTHQPGSRDHHMILSLVYFAGMRPSEAAAVHVEDINLAEDEYGFGVLHVHRGLKRAGEGYGENDEMVGSTKTGVSRQVPIPRELCGTLRAYIGDRTHGPLVRTRNNKPINLGNTSRAWRRACGERQCRVYDLRHACATLWLSAGVPIGEVARRLGNSPEVLMRVYARVLNGDRSLGNQRIALALKSQSE